MRRKTSSGSTPNSSARRVRPSSGKSTRPNFVSYHASRQSFDANPVSERQSASTARVPALSSLAKRRPVHLAVGLLIAGLFLYSLTLSSSPAFVVTNPSGVPMLRTSEVYQQEAQKILSQSITNSTKLTINPTAVADDIQSAFPELETVTVTLPVLGRTPVIEAVTARPALRLSTVSGVYLVTGQGRAVIKADQAGKTTKELKIPLVVDQADLDISEGKGVLSAQDVTFITTVDQQLRSQNLTPVSFELPPLATELHVRISGRPYYIKFSLLTNPRIAAGQYLALNKKLTKDSIVPKEYVDSRVEGKIYYK